jgi:hypothetical protein
MKICLLGCGNQGAGLAGLLAMEHDVDELVFADFDLNRADHAMEQVKRLGGFSAREKKFRTVRANAENVEDVVRAANGVDCVFHGILPAYNIQVMKACLRIGAHYCDLLSHSREVPGTLDAETIEAQLEMDEQFKSAGLCALPCLGVSPGWTTVAAKYMIDQLDSVDRLIVRNVDWLDSKELLACAPPFLVMQMWLGPPNPVRLEDGRITEIDLLSSEETYEFPAPVGRRAILASTLGLDMIILHRFAGKPIHVIEEKGALLSGGLSAKDIWIKAIQQQTSKHDGAENMMALFGKSFLPTVDLDLRKAYETGRIKDGAFASVVEVTGRKGNDNIRHTISCVSTLGRTRELLPWAVPGVFATIGGVLIEMLLKLGRNEFCKRGVLPPTAIDDFQEILKNMRRRGHLLVEKVERGNEL